MRERWKKISTKLNSIRFSRDRTLKKPNWIGIYFIMFSKKCAAARTREIFFILLQSLAMQCLHLSFSLFFTVCFFLFLAHSIAHSLSKLSTQLKLSIHHMHVVAVLSFQNEEKKAHNNGIELNSTTTSQQQRE